MRTIGFMIVALSMIGFHLADPSAAQQPITEPAQPEPARLKVVPVVLIKPGEVKEILLSTKCTVGASRGGGLDIRATEDKARQGLTSSKVWKRDGVSVEVPDFADGSKVTASPLYEPLRTKGIDVFIVRVRAAKDAKLGLYELHIADYTCNGTCTTDLRVLVAAP